MDTTPSTGSGQAAVQDREAPKRVHSDDGSASTWKVHVWVCGTYAGAYEHATSEAAEEMAATRNRDYGIMHCHYEVESPQVRCKACAAYAELMSGLGLHLMVPPCDHLPPNK